MAKTTEQLIPEILRVLGKNDGAMGISEFLLHIRSEVMSHRLLIQALNELARNGQIVLDEKQIKLGSPVMVPA
ncbi:MAG: hypothetical protein JWR15_1209 [Prosthecobacter sp.]|nr:hypothetical protein [Prosthecobacter sp.]